MSNAVFPALKGLGFPVIRRPSFSNLVQESVSGKKKRIGNWLYPRWELELPYNYLLDGLEGRNDLKTLMGFFLSRRGNLDSFLLDNPDDNFIAGQQLGVGDGETLAFQMLRSFGGFIEPCLNIKGDPAPKVYLDGVLQEDGYAIDYLDSGVMTFVTPPAGEEGETPAQIITADFGYYWRCCFKESLAEVEKFLHKVWSGKITLETEK